MIIKIIKIKMIAATIITMSEGPTTVHIVSKHLTAQPSSTWTILSFERIRRTNAVNVDLATGHLSADNTPELTVITTFRDLRKYHNFGHNWIIS